MFRNCSVIGVISILACATVSWPMTAHGHDQTHQTAYVERMMSLDRDSDGFLSPSELPGNLGDLIRNGDVDSDGRLSPAELATIEQKAIASRNPDRDRVPPSGRRRRKPHARVGLREGTRGLNRTGPGSPLDPNQILRFALTFDRDNDGGLNAGELKSYAAALAARRARGRRQPPTGTRPELSVESSTKTKQTKAGLGADGVGDGGFGDTGRIKPR